jgi:hypothetical protein
MDSQFIRVIYCGILQMFQQVLTCVDMDLPPKPNDNYMMMMMMTNYVAAEIKKRRECFRGHFNNCKAL